MLRVSFTLFNLQGTRCSFSAVSALYFSTLSFACQVLFSEVFHFLLSSTLIQARSLSQRNSFILPHSFESVKNFFQVFSGLSVPNRLISVLFELVPLSRANSFSLPHVFRFVKHFFQAHSGVRPASTRSHLRFLPYFSCPPVRRSTIIPSSATFVNTFFLFLRVFFEHPRNEHCAPPGNVLPL